MMAADEINFLRQTLVDLDYREDFDSGSIPLLKHLIGDMKGLSEHCNDVEQENHELRHRLESLLSGEIGESSVIISKMPANANDTYLIEVAESAKLKIEKLTSELEQLRRATADKKGSGASALHNASIKEHQDELAAIKESLGKLIANLRGLSPSLAKDLVHFTLTRICFDTLVGLFERYQQSPPDCRNFQGHYSELAKVGQLSSGPLGQS